VARECASSGGSVDSEAKTLWVQSRQEITTQKTIGSKEAACGLVVEISIWGVKIKACDGFTAFWGLFFYLLMSILRMRLFSLAKEMMPI
jgi:hypothetical protein